MRLLLQRVKRAEVFVEGLSVGAIGQGLLVLLGVHRDDLESVIAPLVSKLVHLRIFQEEDKKMNRSVLDVRGDILVVSQFTLYGNCKQGRRPEFLESAPASPALLLYEKFVEVLRSYPINIETGVFGADMDVSLVNQGPVTLLLDSERL